MTGYKRKRGPDTWRLEVTIGTDARGKPKRYSKTVHGSEKEADKALARFYTECADGKVKKQSAMKIGELCDTYYEEHAKRFLKTSTLHGTKTGIENWIRPYLGHKKCSALTRLDVQRWINLMTDNGLSPKTIRNYVTVLRSMMNFAVNMGIIDDTPCRNLRLPTAEKTEARYLSFDDVKTLLRALQDVTEDEYAYKCAVLLFLFGGLRRGEALGLNWNDVDFKENKIHIHRTRLVDRKGKMYEDTPKTRYSVRTISLPAEVMRELRRLQMFQKERRLKCGSAYTVSDAVLQKPLGGPMYPSSLYRWYRMFLDRAGLPRVGLHALRHTHASMLAHQTTDTAQISERLGHSDLTTTLNIYTHLFENSDREIADALSKEFFQNKRIVK